MLNIVHAEMAYKTNSPKVKKNKFKLNIICFIIVCVLYFIMNFVVRNIDTQDVVFNGLRTGEVLTNFKQLIKYIFSFYYNIYIIRVIGKFPDLLIYQYTLLLGCSFGN